MEVTKQAIIQQTMLLQNTFYAAGRARALAQFPHLDSEFFPMLIIEDDSKSTSIPVV